MKYMSPELKAHFESGVTTTCHLWKITRKDGQVFGYTNFNKDIEYKDLTFYAAAGFNASAVQRSSDMSVNNLELKGPLGNVPTSVSDVDLSKVGMFTDADIQAGLWDAAFMEIWEVNYEDLSMGHLIHDTGYIGNITTGRHTYTAEGRGITQSLQVETGRMITPGCQADLGDSNCRVDISKYTFTGTVSRVDSQHAWLDTTLNQTNSTYQKNITAATKANPIRITCNAHGLASGEKVSFKDVKGMVELNGLTGVVTYVSSNTFTVDIDGTNFSTYTSGGSIIRSVISEYFKDGYIIWLTGNNKGIKADIKTYRPNHVHLHDAMTFPIQVGDTYTIVAGCDKLMPTCYGRFSNQVRFYGFNLVPGNARMISGT